MVWFGFGMSMSMLSPLTEDNVMPLRKRPKVALLDVANLFGFLKQKINEFQLYISRGIVNLNRKAEAIPFFHETTRTNELSKSNWISKKSPATEFSSTNGMTPLAKAPFSPCFSESTLNQQENEKVAKGNAFPDSWKAI
mmetsp:Transcript_33885/g.46455  ORF Transcript_33885/g.46455 Transcript_33885/m.46455 type:complete len:139 (+) Transcript_33885:286-702(+)